MVGGPATLMSTDEIIAYTRSDVSSETVRLVEPINSWQCPRIPYLFVSGRNIVDCPVLV